MNVRMALRALGLNLARSDRDIYGKTILAGGLLSNAQEEMSPPRAVPAELRCGRFNTGVRRPPQ
jgi:hypothetical protein